MPTAFHLGLTSILGAWSLATFTSVKSLLWHFSCMQVRKPSLTWKSSAFQQMRSQILNEADMPTCQGFYEGDVFLDTQFRSPSWTRFPDHLWLLIILHCIVDLHYYYPPKKKEMMSNAMHMHWQIKLNVVVLIILNNHRSLQRRYFPQAQTPSWKADCCMHVPHTYSDITRATLGVNPRSAWSWACAPKWRHHWLKFIAWNSVSYPPQHYPTEL